jgi:tetratricopeptide (TPR) repeat protein
VDAKLQVQRSLAAKPLRLKAARLEREGDLAGAFEAYEAAVSLAPHDPELVAALAQLASRLGMHDHAVGLWAHLAQTDPDGAETSLGHARALIAAGRISDAIDRLKSALLLAPDDAGLWATLGLALTYAGRAGEALTFADEAVRLAPSLAEPLYNRGLALCDLGRLQDAEADFRAAC